VKRLGDCLAIFQIKNASPNELAVAFLGPYLQPAGEGGGGCLCRGCCQVFDRIREVYGRGGGVKVVHGYPLIIGGLHDKSTIRGLRDVEMWLGEVDRRHNGSLPETWSLHNTFLTTADSAKSIESNTCTEQTHTSMSRTNTAVRARFALKLPTALHSPDSVIFVSPGWEDLPRSLPTMGEGDELRLLTVMLEELNLKFALQLDL
jgi:hypothetical protein